MDTILLIKAVLLGIVEGLTEFLPISSTGHLILAGDLLEFQGDLATTFDIVIQLGAILAVVWFFREDLIARLRRLPHDTNEQRFVLLVLLAFVPSGLIGLLVHDWIEVNLFNPAAVAAAQILGALLILWAEGRQQSTQTHSLDTVTLTQALAIGMAQVASLWPGMSRSGSTIIGGMLAGLDRTTATRFSFYLSIPTMFIATGYSLFKSRSLIHMDDFVVLLVGFVVAFVVALFVIQALLRFVTNHTFAVFAYYRIALGLLVLILLAFA